MRPPSLLNEITYIHRYIEWPEADRISEGSCFADRR